MTSAITSRSVGGARTSHGDPGLRVGIDLGTAFIKVVVVGESLEPVASARRPTPWREGAESVAADAVDLQSAVFDALVEALDGIGGVVESVGVVSMGESGIAVDALGRPVWPAIPWHDPLGTDLAGELATAIPGFAGVTGRLPSALCSVVKWRHLAGQGLGARRWYSLAEFVIAALGPVPASEGSLLSRTGALRISGGVVFEAALGWSGVGDQFVTQPVPGGTPAGIVTAGPDRLRGAVAAVVGLDCYAAAVAADATGPGDVFLSCGTSGAAVRVLPAGFQVDVETAAHLGLTVDRWLDGQRLVLLGASPCGLLLQPLRDEVGPPEAGVAVARWQAAFEAVAAGQAQVLDALIKVGGPVARYVGAGGWLQHGGLVRAIDNHVRPIEVAADRELGAIGAASVAAIGPLRG